MRYEHIIQQIDPAWRLERAWTLTGGVSAEVTALAVTLPDGGSRTLLLRSHPGVEREYRLLTYLHGTGLPVARPYRLDPAGMVLDYIDGATDFVSVDLAQCAATLAAIHRTPPPDFLPQQADRCAAKLALRPDMLDESLGEGRIRAALDWPWPQVNPSVLLHGDFWPGNLLWREGRLVGVIDWEDAALGDPLSDLAVCRLEFLWAFGIDAMHAFTRLYQAAMPGLDLAALPHWDLFVALRPMHQLADWAFSYGRSDVTEATLRAAHGWFVEQVLSAS